MMERAGELAARSDTYFTNQLHNVDSLVGYRGVGEELLKQVGEKIDVFAAAVGTSGLLMGVSQALKERGLGTRIVAFEPASSSGISTGEGVPITWRGSGSASFHPSWIPISMTKRRAAFAPDVSDQDYAPGFHTMRSVMVTSSRAERVPPILTFRASRAISSD
jgi:cysteine synthase